MRTFKAKRFVFALFLVSCILCLSLFSCKNKKDDFVVDYHYEYAPLDSGHYVIYDVDSITYNYTDIAKRDSAHYQLKELVGDTFYDGTNDLCRKLDLYRRADETSPWVFDRRWWVKRTKTTYEKIETDLKFIKLVFPPQQDEEWNGNIYIPVTNPYQDFLNWDYLYEKVDEPFMINGINFDSTLTVAEVNDSNLIDKKLRREVYAKNVGMIYQEWEVLRKDLGGTNNWQTGNLNGFRIRMRVREHN